MWKSNKKTPQKPEVKLRCVSYNVYYISYISVNNLNMLLNSLVCLVGLTKPFNSLPDSGILDYHLHSTFCE